MNIHKRAPLLLTAAVLATASLSAAPPAGADPQCTDVAPGTTRCQSPGNVQINTAPTQTGPYLPYPCEPYYLCDYDGIEWSVGGIFGGRGGRD